MTKMPLKFIYLIPSLCAISSLTTLAQEKYTYPTTRKVDTITNYFGTKVTDPYRWLENDTTKETANWVAEQNKVTKTYLEKIPYREAIKNRLQNLWNYTRIGTPFAQGKNLFYFKNDGIQNQSVFYVQPLGEQPKELINPNQLSKDGTVALSSPVPSKSGKLLAYQLAQSGSDWNEIHVIDVQTGNNLTDLLKWVKFSSISWQGDKGFYYSHFDIPQKGQELSGKNEYCKVYFHTIGQPQEKDELIYQDKAHKDRSFSANLTEDERFLILEGNETTSGNTLLVKDSKDPGAKMEPIVGNFENNYAVIDNVGDKLLVLTDKNAPNYQLVLIDPKHPESSSWKTIIPETKHLLKSVNIAGNKLIVKYLKDVSSKIYFYSIEGKEESELQLGGISMVDDINSSKKDSIFYYSYVTFTNPTTIFKYNLNSHKSTVFFQPDLKFNPNDYETKQAFFKSKDGTQVPLFITYKKGLQLNGNNPCFLYGYGGFNISNTPRFSASNMIFLEQGGIYAVANLRGGGEYGENWHKAGTKCNKQNVFDDFISAAEYLFQNKYTTNQKLAIHGRSNGGLLVGATMVERPDLAKVALPGVGVLDMLRYHKFTIGYTWASDYGTSDNQAEFNCLIKYSPLHNVKKVAYPATMVMTGDHDDRVVPAHSFKFAATLQEKNTGAEPMLIRIDTKAGHGAGKPIGKLIEEQADLWSFVFYNLNHTPKYE